MLVTGLVIGLVIKSDSNYLDSLQSGEKTLECNFKDRGWEVVDPSHIKDVEGSLFIFDNGSSSNCRVQSL